MMHHTDVENKTSINHNLPPAQPAKGSFLPGEGSFLPGEFFFLNCTQGKKFAKSKRTLDVTS